uniref:Pantoate--beta-alanine ligase n=2 Tax=Globisporangium ultimum (strain ATCC 200006 / CBS 805.95 / DAOM BR144) TaxID=431595 RepID=K3WP35_GLOUD
MKIIETVADFHAVRKHLPSTATVGLVPTMGGLHVGHLSLVREARKKCDIVAASIFVNPTQFGPNEDYSKYPRTFESDVALLKQEGVDLVFFPSADDMYSKNHRCYVAPEGFDALPEGICRPGHFRGVATVVAKLFNIVRPTHAFFGQKDAAQCVLIKRLVEDLSMDIQIQVVDVCREQDGLAMSTRNQYLEPDERKVASVVYRGLTRARDVFLSQKQGEAAAIDAELLRTAIRQEYESEPFVNEIQYISVGSKETMEELEFVSLKEGAILSVAVKLGKCRLIDTLTL